MLVAGVVVGPTDARAAEPRALPVEHQVKLTKTIFTFERTFHLLPEVQVLVVHADGRDIERARRTAGAFVTAGVPARVAPIGDAARFAEKANVLFLASDDLATDTIAFPNRLMTITGRPSYAKGDQMSVCLLAGADGRARIVVDLVRLRREGRHLNSRMLGLRVVTVKRR